jgi:tetratricopeptide (TPR) repeat protein
LAAASALLDSARPQEALTLLDRLLARQAKNPSALLLRSTAHFMLGNMSEGRRDLDRSIALDPENRQAWLNRAALELADESYAKALEAFSRAEALDRAAPDNSLNIGAVLLLLNRFEEAEGRFKDYLARNPRDPRARYLVASNYAMLGFVQPVVANLRRAIAMDEKFRREARTDPNFDPVSGSAEFQELLGTDSYRHPAGASVVAITYDELPYLAGQSAVLDAVISALQLAGRAFEAQVEVTPEWALVWSDVRIKVSDSGAGGTQLELSAPPGRFSPGQWQAITDDLLRGVKIQLLTRSRKSGTR